MMFAQQIVNAMDAHIRANGGGYSNWYVGIASDPDDRLINGHNAGGINNAARYWNCGSDAVAREVEAAFINVGCAGGPGGGDEDTKFAYTYFITTTTRE